MRGLVLAVVMALLAAPAAARAEGSELEQAERAGRVGFDLLVLRPLNLVTTAISLAGAAVAYPVAWPFGGQDHVVEYLVERPVDRTFRRPLGEL